MQKLDPKFVWFMLINSTFSWLFTWVVLFVGFGISFVLSANEEGGSALSGVLGLVFAGFFAFLVLTILASYVWARLTYHYYRYELREDGFRKEHGVIWKKYVTIPYDRIQNVDIYRGILSRLLGLSDLQVQTAGGITAGSYGAFSEGRLPGLSKEVAEELRDELVRRARASRSQGL